MIRNDQSKVRDFMKGKDFKIASFFCPPKKKKKIFQIEQVSNDIGRSMIISSNKSEFKPLIIRELLLQNAGCCEETALP